MDFPFPSIEQIIVGLLVLLRVGAIVILLPALGHQLVPQPIKIGLVMLLTIVTYPIVAPQVHQIPIDPVAFAAIALQEILIAGAIALFAQLVFTAAQFGGQLMSFQMGMTVANVFDPATHTQQSVLSQVAMTLAMLLWLATGAHHLFIRAMIDSFTLFPIDHPWSFPGLLTLTEAASQMFVLALKIASPIMLLLTFIYITLGLLARAVPQVQVFFVSFPLTVGFGLLTLSLGMPAFIYLMNDAFAALSLQVPLFLRHLAGN